MIKAIIDKPKNHQIQMTYEIIDDNPKVFINENDEIVGYIWYTVENETMHIKMIEMIEKEKGYGTEAVNFLLNYFPIKQITGQVLGEVGMRAYWFWESLGAEMSVPFEEVENSVVRDCFFVLKK